MSNRTPQQWNLAKAKVIGTIVVLAFLVGLLFTAINRGPNDAYVVLVALAIAGVVLTVVVSLSRRRPWR
jgi:membrane protein YdbS with pleckstrin-like domain